MAIKRSGSDLAKLPGVTFMTQRNMRLPLPKVDHDNELASAIAKIADAVAASNDAQRVVILQASSVNAEIAAALRARTGWAGNWDVTITKRDALGRISEVQFKPAKP